MPSNTAKKHPDQNKVDRTGAQVSISVNNEGNPIPKEDQDNLFTFLNSSQDDNNDPLKSWGMGLSLVKIVAKAYGGKVMVKSDKEEDTSFTILLDRDYNCPGKK